MNQYGDKTREQRFWEKVGFHDDPSVCWIWQAGVVHAFKLSYGRFWDGCRTVLAHRYSYILHVGPIPEGYTIDHVKARGCTSTLCVNPAHLEAVTLRENVLRGDTIAAVESKATCCPKGHLYDVDNTYVWLSGKRGCRACNRERATLRREKNHGTI